MTESGIVKMLMQSSTINSHLEHQIKSFSVAISSKKEVFASTFHLEKIK